MKKILILIMAVIAFNLPSPSQESRFSSGGYASWLNMAVFEKPSDTWLNSSMLHNRLNFKAYPTSHLTVSVEVRNRFVAGDMVLLDQDYSAGLASDPGWIDMSWNILSGKSFVLNTMIDRAWIEFSAGNLQIRAGRQRINWSQALVWNPNDIFNTYSFFDFDYIERPGSDALRIILSTGPSSAAEGVVKVNNLGKVTAAALYRFSFFNTDLQFLAGETDEELFTAGTGWSGSTGSVSVRGETTLFVPFRKVTEEKSTLIVTAGIDRVFSDKVTVLAQVMYSNNPVELNDFSELYDGGMTARQLAFSRFSTVGQISYAPMPLINISFSAIWFPDLKGWYTGPAIDYSLAENIGFSFIWQHFNSSIGGSETRINLGFLRFKYNF